MSGLYEILSDSEAGSAEISVSESYIYSYHIHTHLYYEMLFYRPFGGGITINEKRIEINEPAAVLIAPGDFHSTELTGNPSRVIKIKCGSEGLKREYKTSILFAGENDTMIEQLFSAALKYRGCAEYLASVVGMTASEIEFRGRNISETVSGKASVVSKAMQYINRNFGREATLSKAAAAQHISPQYLSAVFSQTAGITFREYLIEKRLSVAASLLKSGEYTVTAAAYECGYESSAHFTRSFKNKYGVSPRNFMKTHGEEANKD